MISDNHKKNTPKKKHFTNRCHEADSNRQPKDFQSFTLPLSYRDVKILNYIKRPKPKYCVKIIKGPGQININNINKKLKPKTKE